LQDCWSRRGSNASKTGAGQRRIAVSGIDLIKDVEQVRTEFEVSALPNLKTPERGNVPVHSGESVDRVAAGGA
jgi:hypothetical protein